MEKVIARGKVAVLEYDSADAFFRRRSKSLSRGCSLRMKCVIQRSKFCRHSSLSDLMDGLNMEDWDKTKFKKYDSDAESFEVDEIINSSRSRQLSALSTQSASNKTDDTVELVNSDGICVHHSVQNVS